MTLNELIILCGKCASKAVKSGASEADFDDLKQEAFIGGWKALQRGSAPSYRAMGVIWDFLRTKNQHRSRLNRFSPVFIPLDIVQISYTPVDYCSHIDLHKAINDLDIRSREVILSYYFKDMDEVDISMNIKVSRSRVSQLLSAARAEMYAYLTS